MEPSTTIGDAAAEAAALRTAAGVLDVSDHAVLRVTGNDRISLLQRLTTNDLKRLAAGGVQWTCFTTAKGRVLDRARVLLDPDAVLLVTSPGRAADVIGWLAKYTIIEDVAVEPLPAAVLHLLGPHAADLAARIASTPAPAPGRFTRAHIAGAEVLLAGTEGLLQHPGVLMIAPPDAASGLIAAIIAAGGRPVGSVAYAAARVEQGLPLFGHEVGPDDNPLEAGFWDAVSFDKGCYVGQEVLARLRNYDKLMRLMAHLASSAPLTPGMPLFADGKEAGTVGSATAPPLSPEPRALGYVKKRVVQAGTVLRAGDPDHGCEVRVLRPVRIEAPPA